LTKNSSAPSRRHTGWSPPSAETTVRRDAPVTVRTETSGRPASSETYAIHLPFGAMRASRSVWASASRGRATPPAPAGTVQMSLVRVVLTFTTSPRPSCQRHR
jgi:hypothetical protein